MARMPRNRASATERQHSRQTTPIQAWETNTRSSPIQHERTNRQCAANSVTTSFGGKLVPLMAKGLLREDGINNSVVTIQVQMAETANMLLNPVRIAAAAYLVPKLAFERFSDMGNIDRSYNGQQEKDGAVTPWFLGATGPAPGGASEINRALGLHEAQGGAYNLDYIEAYNAIWNYIAANRSPSLTLRTNTDDTLGPAFWSHTQLKHVVPTFDDAMMEGVIPLGIQQASPLYVTVDAQGAGTAMSYVRSSDGASRTMDSSGNTLNTGGAGGSAEGRMYVDLSEAAQAVTTLAAIDTARETAAWARLRTQFQGKSDEWMMDQLLAGMRLNDDALKYPILLDTSETTVGMSQRYATDSANLKKSVVDGRTSLQLRMRSPAVQCGGVVMVVAQALPEQIYERQRDYYHAATIVDDLPNRISDELDPQPVEMVKNIEVDEHHTAPGDLFGYAPLNHRWTGGGPKLGGRYFKDDPGAAWTEDRNRIWDSGAIDPALGPDFYMSTQLQHEVFEDSNTEPFEWWLAGSVSISGLTYFGPSLRESLDDYDAVLGMVDTDRLKGDGSDV